MHVGHAVPPLTDLANESLQPMQQAGLQPAVFALPSVVGGRPDAMQPRLLRQRLELRHRQLQLILRDQAHYQQAAARPFSLRLRPDRLDLHTPLRSVQEGGLALLLPE